MTAVALLLAFGADPAARAQISTTGLLDHFNPNLGVTTDDFGNVSGWTNQATPGRSVTAGNATTTVVAGPNGSMLRFDAADGSGQLAYASAGSAAYADGLTVFTVVRFNSPTSAWNSFPRLWRGANDNVAIFLRTNGITEVKLGGYSRPTSSYTTAYQLGDPTADPPTLGQIAIVATRASASERQLFFNGAVAATQTGGASTFAVDNTTLQIGNSVRGDMGDVLVYDSNATLSDFHQTGITLAQAYGVPWTLSGGAASITQAITVPITFAGGTLALGTGGSIAVTGGTLAVNAGEIRFSGDAGTIGSNRWRIGVGAGNAGVAVIDTSATLEAAANSLVGDSGGRGALRQSAGTVSLTSSYFALAGGGGYGHHRLSGGTFSALNTSSGNYLVAAGGGGVGVLEIAGGRFDLARFLVGSDGSTSFGQVSVTAGTLDANPGGTRNGTIMVANDGSGRLNIGTLEGGAGTVIVGSQPISLVFQDSGAAATASGYLNLNSGTIRFNHASGGIRGSSSGDLAANRDMDLALNGGRLVANAANVSLIRGGTSAPKRTLLFNGGLTVDTQGFATTLDAAILPTTGNGFYRSTTFTATPTGDAGAGYIGPPIVAVSGGSGSGAQVNALVDTVAGTITGFVVTNPGQGYQAGDTLTFTLSGNAGSTLAAPYTYTLQASDLAANGTGIFRKEGTGTLTLSAANTFTGETRIAAGTLQLAATGSLLSSLITIDSGATFDASLVSGFALLPGQALGGRGTFNGSVLLNDGAGLMFDAAGPFTIAGGTMSFAAGFGIGDIVGLDGASVAEGTYTLVAGSIDLTGLANVGFANRAGIGGSKEAYFQEGSLQLVVVPEPGTVALMALGLLLGGGAVARRRGRRCHR